jgi:hypothetical protein
VRTAVLKNTQTKALVISSIAISGGTAPGDYAWGGNCPITPKTLGAGRSCSVTVTFTPSAAGSRTASLTVTDNASNSPQSAALTGTGILPVAVSPASLTFPARRVGTTSAAAIVMVLNHLNTELLFSSITASGAFAVASNTCSSGLGPGLKCAIGVTFTPTAVGQQQGTLTINDSAFGSPSLIALSGTGVETGLTSISVTPANPSIAAGTTQQFTATGRFSNGSTQNLTPYVTWSSSAQSVATIAAGGLAAAVTTGSSSIGATIGGVAGSTTLTVTPPVLVSIAIAPANSSLSPGNTQQFAATGTYSDGSTQTLTSTATWSSSVLAIATISNASGSQGLATAVAAGNTTIAATSGAINGSTTLTVTASFVSTGNLNSARYSHTATLLDGGMVLIAGGTGTSIPAAAELYNPTAGTFTPTGGLNIPRSSHTATLLNNGMVLIAGGYDANGNILAGAELYNPANGTFTPTGGLNTARAYHTATLLSSGAVLIAGGVSYNGQNFYPTVAELYNPATGTFTLTGNLNTVRASHTATLLNNGTVLIAGGANSNGVLAASELYNPATATFTPSGNLNAPREFHTATLLNNGLVLMAGGDGATGLPAIAELYNSTTGSFSNTGTLNTARYSHTATLLTNGTVLITAGINFAGSPLASAELYDPIATTFTLTGSMNIAIAYQTATLLNNGMALIAGGWNSSGIALTNAELYEPSTLTPPNLVSISLSPGSPTVSVSAAQQFIATGTFSNSSTEQLVAVNWSSSNPAIATLSDDATDPGTAYALANGTATVSGCAGSICGSTTLTVAPPALVSIAITPPNSTPPAGTSVQFDAVGTYSDGSMQDLTSSAAWSSSAPGVATISPAGLATALVIGNSTITATSGSIQGTASLTVISPVLTSIAITPVNSSIAGGGAQQFTATGIYSDGSTQNLTTTVTWSSSAPGVATIGSGSGSQGLASAVAPGITSITAASSLINASTTLTVTGFVLTGNLNTARELHTATLLTNGTVLIAAGQNSSLGSPYLNSAELYNAATGTFMLTGNLNTARDSHTATLLNNGMVLIAGGMGSGAVATSAAELYNPATGTFTPTGNLNTARYSHTATLLNNGMVLIAGGIDGNGNVSITAELYNPATGTFTATGSLNTARYQHTATLLNTGLVLLAGGASSGGSALLSAELYNPATGSFTPTGTLNTARFQHTATLLNNGTTLMAGGIDGNGNISSTAELYNSAAGTFTSTNSLNAARSQHTATLLNNGTALIAGGDALSGILASAEVYDPVATTFTLTGSMNVARDQHTSTLLANGMGLIAGGLGSTGPLSSAELYQPATLTPPNLVSIALTPTTATISPGTALQLIATGTFSDSNTQQLASVTWSSSKPTVISITDDATDLGAAYALATGTSTVSACTGSVCGSATLTVAVPTLVSIAVNPASGSVQAGFSLQFDALGTYSDSSTQDVTSTATWSSSVPVVATITPGGLATGVTTGVSSIGATVGGVSGSAPLTVTTTALMPLGTVSAGSSQVCPAIVNGQPADWVTGTSGGTDIQALCYRATVSCPNMPDLGVTYGVATPAGLSNGTIAFVSAKGGENTLPGSSKNQAPFDLFHAGFQTVQFAWDTEWQNGSSAGSFKVAACRVATFLNFVNSQFYQANANNTPTAGMCAHGQSGGAGGIAMSLTYYGVSSFLDKAVFVSGPHYADMVQGCSVPNAPAVNICPTVDGDYPMGCNSQAGTWTNVPVYTGGAAKQLTVQLADNPPCNDPTHTYTAQDELNLTATSLVDGAPDANYIYPQTAITAWECDDDTFWQNPSEAQGWIYFSQLRSPSQVAPNCNFSSKNTPYPTACLDVNRVFGCTSVELAATGWVCNGSTCPVCTGNPATNCTCGGVPCSSVSTSYGMPTFREQEYEDPINGFIKRH